MVEILDNKGKQLYPSKLHLRVTNEACMGVNAVGLLTSILPVIIGALLLDDSVRQHHNNVNNGNAIKMDTP